MQKSRSDTDSVVATSRGDSASGSKKQQPDQQLSLSNISAIMSAEPRCVIGLEEQEAYTQRLAESTATALIAKMSRELSVNGIPPTYSPASIRGEPEPIERVTIIFGERTSTVQTSVNYILNIYRDVGLQLQNNHDGDVASLSTKATGPRGVTKEEFLPQPDEIAAANVTDGCTKHGFFGNSNSKADKNQAANSCATEARQAEDYNYKPSSTLPSVN